MALTLIERDSKEGSIIGSNFNEILKFSNDFRKRLQLGNGCDVFGYAFYFVFLSLVYKNGWEYVGKFFSEMANWDNL